MKTMTWGKLQILGLVGGVLVLVLVAVVVIINVFAAPGDSTAAGDGEVTVVEGEAPLALDEWGMLTPPETEDPAVYGPLAAAALYTYDTRVANYAQARAGIEAWLTDYEAEVLNVPMPPADASEAISQSEFPGEGVYREQSERAIKVTATVVGEPKVNEDHRDWAESLEYANEYEAYNAVTTMLEVTYEFTNDDGTRRTLVETVTVTAEMRCGLPEFRPTSNCKVFRFAEEFFI